MLSLTAFLGLTLPALAGAPKEVQAVVSGNNQFALDLYAPMARHDGNLFFSPYSVNKTLAMAYAGARGDTAREMAAVLHVALGPDQHSRAFLETRKLLNRSGAATRPGPGNPFRGKREVQFYLSANLWGQRGYGFPRAFLSLLQECYGAGLEEVDFAAPEKARQAINAWAERQTNHKIRGLFPPDALNVNTRLVLASAIYFKGDWLHAFPRGRTRGEAFRSNAGRTAPVPTMNQTDSFGYFENDGLQVLQMPYVGKDLAMVVFLPKKVDGLPGLEKALKDQLATWTGGLREQQVEVSFPKCTFTSECSLKDTLASLGMTRAFSPAEADFSGMGGGRERLYVSAVTHKAFVDVNEEGTEAAAAAGAAVGSLSLPTRLAVPVFRADHPFVFAIRDVRTGLLLFLGRVVKP